MENTRTLGLEIEPCDDISKQKGLIKLELTSSQKIHTSALFQQLPSMVATGIMANAYTMKLPSGVTPSDLMHYHNGGVGNSFFGENGIAGQAPLYSLQSQAIVMGAFTAMSIASGQYFLSEINNNLSAINQKADKILEFLYGDKKAELMSEVSFVNFAYQNYNSIMANDTHRTATIVNIQEAKKVAIKDIEFYMSDLNSLTKKKDISNLDIFVKEAFQIKDYLQLAIQLYCMSNVLEVYYSQNTETTYLEYVEKDIATYIDKCEKRMLSDFSAIKMYITNYKGSLLKKFDKAEYENQIGKIVDLLESGEELIKRKPLQTVLESYKKKYMYYLDKEGDMYLQAI